VGLEYLVQQIPKELILKGDFHTMVAKKAIVELIKQYQDSLHKMDDHSDVPLGAQLNKIIKMSDPLEFQVEKVAKFLLVNWKANQLKDKEQSFLDVELLKDWKELLRQMQERFDPMLSIEKEWEAWKNKTKKAVVVPLIFSRVLDSSLNTDGTDVDPSRIQALVSENACPIFKPYKK
jgi:hypothetical protein